MGTHFAQMFPIDCWYLVTEKHMGSGVQALQERMLSAQTPIPGFTLSLSFPGFWPRFVLLIPLIQNAMTDERD